MIFASEFSSINGRDSPRSHSSESIENMRNSIKSSPPIESTEKIKVRILSKNTGAEGGKFKRNGSNIGQKGQIGEPQVIPLAKTSTS